MTTTMVRSVAPIRCRVEPCIANVVLPNTKDLKTSMRIVRFGLNCTKNLTGANL